MPPPSPLLKASYLLSRVRTRTRAVRSSPATEGVKTLGTALSAAIGPLGNGRECRPSPSLGQPQKRPVVLGHYPNRKSRTRAEGLLAAPPSNAERRQEQAESGQAN